MCNENIRIGFLWASFIVYFISLIVFSEKDWLLNKWNNWYQWLLEIFFTYEIIFQTILFEFFFNSNIVEVWVDLHNQAFVIWSLTIEYLCNISFGKRNFIEQNSYVECLFFISWAFIFSTLVRYFQRKCNSWRDVLFELIIFFINLHFLSNFSSFGQDEGECLNTIFVRIIP